MEGFLGFPCGSAGEESACKARDLGSIPGLGRFLWRRERPPTPVFWPGEFHGLSSMESQRVGHGWAISLSLSGGRKNPLYSKPAQFFSFLKRCWLSLNVCPYLCKLFTLFGSLNWMFSALHFFSSLSPLLLKLLLMSVLSLTSFP